MPVRAVAAANRALQLDSTNGGAHAALGHALFNFYHQYAAGEQHLKRALELDSSYNSARLFLGILYNDQGQTERGIALLQQALVQDPLSSPVRTTLSRFYITANRFPEALEQARISIAINPGWSLSHVMAGLALVQQRNLTEAGASFSTPPRSAMLRIRHSWPMAWPLPASAMRPNAFCSNSRVSRASFTASTQLSRWRLWV
jgi:tetratricopeptide (TPR) repeat protein